MSIRYVNVWKGDAVLMLVPVVVAGRHDLCLGWLAWGVVISW